MQIYENIGNQAEGKCAKRDYKIRIVLGWDYKSREKEVPDSEIRHNGNVCVLLFIGDKQKSSGSCEPKPKQKRMKKMMFYFFLRYSCTLSAGTISSLNM